MSKLFCLVYIIVFALLCSCQSVIESNRPKVTAANADAFNYIGRVDNKDPTAPVLAGPASYVEFGFEGDSVVAHLTATDFNDGHSWVAVEINGGYFGRFRVDAKDTLHLTIPRSESDDGPHTVRIHHAAEPLFGRLVFLGAEGKIVTPKYSPEKLIVFFGDSMSCGAASDTSSGPCNYAGPHDNSNAYLAFPARVGRAMDAHFIVHAVSGRGMYSNWNGQDPPLPALLPYLYLDTANATPYNMSMDRPIAAVIALGTNDLNSAPSLRPEFDSTTFENTYVSFIKTHHSIYPETAFLLSTSVMHGGEKGLLLSRTLDRVIDRCKQLYPDLNIGKSQLTEMELHGCPAGPHPSVEEHGVIAAELTSDLKRLLSN